MLLHFTGTTDSSEKLEKHLSLLKEEYTKLQRNYADLERKYSKAAAASGDKDLGEFSSFVSRLAMTVASLYGRKTYSDITIRLCDKTIPAHKFVLNARSEEWREEVLADINELGKCVPFVSSNAIASNDTLHFDNFPQIGATLKQTSDTHYYDGSTQMSSICNMTHWHWAY